MTNMADMVVTPETQLTVDTRARRIANRSTGYRSDWTPYDRTADSVNKQVLNTLLRRICCGWDEQECRGECYTDDLPHDMVLR
jgi:hypothetical protein